MEKIKIIALFGESGSGKDTILENICLEYDYHKIIRMTTRPPREGETEENYYFTNAIVFAKKILNGELIEATSFRDWFYGTDIDSLDKDAINIGAFDIPSIECMLEDSRLEVHPIRIKTNEKERLVRSLDREINPDYEEICRRFLADKKDFSNIDFKYISVPNNKGEINLAIDLIRDYIIKNC